MYKRLDINDIIKVATKTEKMRLDNIFDMALYKRLANRWCDLNGYKLGYYLGDMKFDATKSSPQAEH